MRLRRQNRSRTWDQKWNQKLNPKRRIAAVFLSPIVLSSSTFDASRSAAGHPVLRPSQPAKSRGNSVVAHSPRIRFASFHSLRFDSPSLAALGVEMGILGEKPQALECSETTFRSLCEDTTFFVVFLMLFKVHRERIRVRRDCECGCSCQRLIQRSSGLSLVRKGTPCHCFGPRHCTGLDWILFWSEVWRRFPRAWSDFRDVFTRNQSQNNFRFDVNISVTHSFSSWCSKDTLCHLFTE
jgi:hypothetical protein